MFANMKPAGVCFYKRFKLFLLYFICIFAFANLHAQEFNFSQITLRDGLPSSQINCIYQDDEGYIWIGTNEGIKKYVGKSFIDIYAQNPVSLSRPIKSIAESEKHIWFANDRSLFKCVGNYTEEYPLFTKINPVLINKIIPASDSLLYILTTLGVWEFKDNKFTQLYTNLKIDVENITCGYFHKSENELWLGTDGSGIYAINTLNNTLVKSHQAIYDSLKNEKIKDIESYFDSKIFISVLGRGIMQYNYNAPIWLEALPETWLAYTSDISVDKKGNIWFATLGSGLIKYDEKEFEIITEENGLAQNNLLCATSDNYGNVWCGTSSLGVSILLNENFLIYNTKQNLPAPNCRQITQINNGQWLLCTSGGACFFDGKNISPFYHQKVENTTCADYNPLSNQIVLGHYYSDVDIYDCATKKVINQIKTGAEVFALKFLKDTALLIGTNKQGLLIYNLKTKQLKSFSPQFNTLSVNSIAVDNETIWIGTDRGLYCIQNNEVAKLVDKDNQLSESAVSSISCSNNYMYAATNGFGLFKYNKSSKMLEQIERKQGLQSIVIKAVQAINDNEIYISSSNSLYKIVFESNEIKINTLIESFSRNNAEFLQGSLMQGSSGNFYLGTSKGLLVYKQAESGDLLKGLVVKLTAVQLFNDTTNWQRLGFNFNSKANIPEQLVLPYNKNDLTFYFEVFNSLGDNKCFLKYKLEGSDKKWVYTEKTNHAIYSNLSDGKYTFFVSVSFDGRNWSAPAEFSFEIEVPFWKTNSFLVLVLALLTCIIAFFLRFFKSYKDDLIKSSNVNYNLPNTRIILICGAILVPVSAFVYAAINDDYDAKLFYQITVGALMLMLMLLTYTSRFIKINGRIVLIGAFYIITGLYVLLSYLSNLTPYFFMGLVLIINIAHLVINKIKPFAIYATLVMLASTFLFFAVKNPTYSPGMFMMIIITSIILTLVSIQVQLNLYDRLFFADTTINTGNSLVIASNKDGEIVFASKNFEQILGYTEQELLGDGWWKIRSDDETHNQTVKDSVVGRNIERNSVERIIDKKGVPRWIQWENSFFENNLVVGIGIDITDKKEIEERYQHIVEAASDIIYTTDINGLFTYVNEVGARIIGYTNEQLLHMRFNRLIRKDYEKNVTIFYRKQLKSQTEESYIELPIITQDGKEVWVGQSAKLYRDEKLGNKIVGFHVICRDVTERIEAQKQIEEKNKRIQLYSEKLELLNGVKQIILEATQKTDLIERLLTELRLKITDAKRATLTLFDDDIKTAYLYEYKEDQGKIDLQVLPASDYRSLPNLLKNQYFKVDDLYNSGEHSKSDDIVKKLGINSYLITPLFFNGKLTGAFNLASEHKNLFDEDYVNFARQIADAVAITLSQISNKETIEQQNIRIQSYSERLQVINKIKKEFINAKSQTELINSVLYKLCTSINQYKSTFVTFHNQQSKKLETFFYDIHTSSIKQHLQIGKETFNYNAFDKKDYLLYSSVKPSQIENINSFPDDTIKANTRSFLSVAIKRGNHVTGTISVLSSKPDTFSEQDIQILTDLAESIQLGVEQITYRKELSEKNKDISDNIDYSRRIQQSVMPPESYMKEMLPESFIILKQRDVIGGDFYWCYRKDDKIFVALGDCTGHGVSGALLSILCSNIISQAIKEYNMFDPGLILDFLNRKIKESLNQYKQADEILDGLDVSLCVLDLKYGVLLYSGAMHNLYLVNKGNLNEIKGNRIPIGGIASGLDTQFTTQIRLLHDDLKIYMSTDGYFDQFNGTEIKKYSKSRFKLTLLDIEDMPFSKQKNYLWKQHIEWKKNGSQTDDICVIGYSLKGLLKPKTNS